MTLLKKIDCINFICPCGCLRIVRVNLFRGEILLLDFQCKLNLIYECLTLLSAQCIGYITSSFKRKPIQSAWSRFCAVKC